MLAGSPVHLWANKSLSPGKGDYFLPAGRKGGVFSGFAAS